MRGGRTAAAAARLAGFAASLALVAAAAGAGSPKPGDPADNRAFVAAAAREAGAVQTASGLVYIVRAEGSGAAPKPTSVVRVHYRGTLIDGSEFDSSHARNAPAEFPLDEVIPCWTEGLQKMREGWRARLVCPAATAYGSMGTESIPPHATLVFDVELIKITRF